MEIGRIKWFNNAKGYGFICNEKNEEIDIFVHFSVVQMRGYKTLKQGQVVKYQEKEGPKGLHASIVIPVSEKSSYDEEDESTNIVENTYSTAEKITTE